MIYHPSEETGEILCRKRQSKSDSRHKSNVAKRQWETNVLVSADVVRWHDTNIVYSKAEKPRKQVEVFRVISYRGILAVSELSATLELHLFKKNKHTHKHPKPNQTKPHTKQQNENLINELYFCWKHINAGGSCSYHIWSPLLGARLPPQFSNLLDSCSPVCNQKN